MKETEEGVILLVKVIPKASCTEIVGWENEELKIRVMAVPEKGKANDYLLAFLAKKLKVAKSNLTLLYGETSRHKKVLIKGFKASAVLELLNL
jgi:uncharacterized protein (TIGR00251 family)